MTTYDDFQIIGDNFHRKSQCLSTLFETLKHCSHHGILWQNTKSIKYFSTEFRAKETFIVFSARFARIQKMGTAISVIKAAKQTKLRNIEQNFKARRLAKREKYFMKADCHIKHC